MSQTVHIRQMVLVRGGVTKKMSGNGEITLKVVKKAKQYQLDCSPSLATEPQLRLEAAKSTTGFAKFTSYLLILISGGPYN